MSTAKDGVKSSVSAGAGTDQPDQDDFKLEEFFPYLIRIFYSDVTSKVSRIYESQYEMKPYEWRTMAILGLDQTLTAMQIMERSSMDKVSVSRAVSALRKRGWIIERTNNNDGRSRMLRLSAAGRKVYNHLVPQMVTLEADLLSDLEPREVRQLKSLMARVRKSAEMI